MPLFHVSLLVSRDGRLVSCCPRQADERHGWVYVSQEIFNNSAEAFVFCDASGNGMLSETELQRVLKKFEAPEGVCRTETDGIREIRGS